MPSRQPPFDPHQDNPAPPGSGLLPVLAFVLYAVLATLLNEQPVGWTLGLASLQRSKRPSSHRLGMSGPCRSPGVAAGSAFV